MVIHSSQLLVNLKEYGIRLKLHENLSTKEKQLSPVVQFSE